MKQRKPQKSVVWIYTNGKKQAAVTDTATATATLQDTLGKKVVCLRYQRLPKTHRTWFHALAPFQVPSVLATCFESPELVSLLAQQRLGAPHGSCPVCPVGYGAAR